MLALTASRLPELIAGLSRPDAYPHAVRAVEVVQTHASVVFLAGQHAYKLKKPVDLGFLDFSSVEKRRAACDAEVRLNRRLARGVYVGVEPVTRDAAGRIRVGGPADVVDHVVHMTRLPDGRTLAELLARGELTPELLERVARHLAAFHATAESGPEIAAHAGFDALDVLVRDNLSQVEAFLGVTLDGSVLVRLACLFVRELVDRRALIEDRVRRGLARDTHGDLRLDHVYFIPGRADGELVIVDCIEFNDRFRHGDPIGDVAFLTMELEHAGRPDLARAFTRGYAVAAQDADGESLLPLHVAHRHVVRGKVRSIESREEEVPEPARCRAADRARSHFLMALAKLARPDERPGLLLVGGLPGTGKSTVARGLESEHDFERVSSDETRKELAGVPVTAPARDAFGRGMYTPQWTARTYAACLVQAESLLLAGKRVVVDATFREDAWRRQFLELGRRLGVPATFIRCELPVQDVERRLAARRDDASDADLAVHLESAARWEPAGPDVAAIERELSTVGARDDMAGRVREVLVASGLAS